MDTETDSPVLVTVDVHCLSGARTPQMEECAQTLQLSIREGQTFRIGRSRSNDLILLNQDVSRFHATIQATRETVLLSDLSSSNGTFVNGRIVSAPVRISSGDTITMGNAKLSVELVNAPTDIELRASSTHLAQMANVDLTVMLVDIAGYTKLSQLLPPTDVTNMLRRWFEVANPIIAENNGHIDKYIGDCIMAIWKDPLSEERQSARYAVRTALSIIDATKSLASSGVWPHEQELPWRCRAAVHTGSALMGGLTGGAKHFTVLGDAVNVVFRIEGYASKLGADLVMSSVTADLIKDEYELKNLGQFHLEGRSGEEAIYTVAR